MQFPTPNTGEHMTTANNASRSQKDIVTAFVRHKESAKK